MTIRRIEIDGETGHVAIERQRGNNTIRIDSIIRDPKRGQRAWVTIELPSDASEEKLFAVAAQLFERTEGVRGGNGDIHEVFRELRRFQG